MLETVSFARNHTAFSSPLALPANTLWKLIIERKPLFEELSILRQEEYKTLTDSIFSLTS